MSLNLDIARQKCKLVPPELVYLVTTCPANFGVWCLIRVL